MEQTEASLEIRTFDENGLMDLCTLVQMMVGCPQIEYKQIGKQLKRGKLNLKQLTVLHEGG